jgi:carbon storage regulator
MNIVTVDFEEPIFIQLGDEFVQLISFKTQERGNVKFGVEAPRSINVHREEIYYAIKLKEQQKIADEV